MLRGELSEEFLQGVAIRGGSTAIPTTKIPNAATIATAMYPSKSRACRAVMPSSGMDQKG